MNHPKDKTLRRQRAKKLMKQYEISHKLAFDVVNGECSLHEALVASKKQAQQQILIDRYGFTEEESRKVINDELNLNVLLSKKFSKEHIDDTDAAPNLIDGFKGVFWLHGPRKVTAEVYECDRYACLLLHKDGQDTVQKHDIKAFAESDISPQSLEEQASTPILRIEERYRISNRLLYQYVLDKTLLKVSLLGGLCFEGVFERVGRFECELKTSEGILTVMRHALLNIEEKE